MAHYFLDNGKPNRKLMEINTGLEILAYYADPFNCPIAYFPYGPVNVFTLVTQPSIINPSRKFYEHRAIHFDLTNSFAVMMVPNEFLDAFPMCHQTNEKYIYFKNIHTQINYLILLDVSESDFIDKLGHVKSDMELPSSFDFWISRAESLTYPDEYILYLPMSVKLAYIKYELCGVHTQILESAAQEAEHPYKQFPKYLSSYWDVVGDGECGMYGRVDYGNRIRAMRFAMGFYYLDRTTMKNTLRTGKCKRRLTANRNSEDWTRFYNMLKRKNYNERDLESCIYGLSLAAVSMDICKIICALPQSNVILAEKVIYDTIDEVCKESTVPKEIIKLLMDFSAIDADVIYLKNDKTSEMLAVFNL